MREEKLMAKSRENSKLKGKEKGEKVRGKLEGGRRISKNDRSGHLEEGAEIFPVVEETVKFTKD